MKRPQHLYKMILTASAVFIAGILTGVPPYPAVAGSTQPALQQAEPAKSAYTFYLDEESGRFEITNPETGTAWESNPENWREDMTAKDIWRSSLNSQLMVDFITRDGKIADKTNSYRGSVKMAAASFVKKDNGYQAIFRFDDQKFTIPLKVTLIGDYLEAKVNVRDIVNEGIYEITSISLLPYFGSSTVQDSGFLFVPSGSGGIITFNNGRITCGDFLTKIYGNDPSIASGEYFNTGEQARMPVFGVSKNENSFLAVIGSGASLSSLTASISGANTERNTVYPTFMLKSVDNFYIRDYSNKEREFTIIDNMKQDIGEISVRYYLLDQKNTYSDMAMRYKKYLVEEKGLVQKTPSYSLALDVYGAALKEQLFLGFTVQRPAILSDAEDISGAIDTLNQNGIQDITLNLKKATRNSIYNERLDSSKILRSIGSPAAIAALRNRLGNGELFVAVEPMQANSKGVFNPSANRAAKKINNLTVKLNRYNLETNAIEESKSNYLFSPSFVSQNIQGIKKRSVGTNICFESIGEILYSDFGRRQLNREESSAVIAAAMQAYIDGNTASVIASGANAYLYPYLTHINDIPTDSGKNVLIDYSVPFLQMALSGLIEYAGAPVNLSANPQMAFLKSVESGSSLHFSFIFNETSLLRDTELSWLCGAEYDMWKEGMIAFQQSFARMTRATENSVMAGHRILAPGITETTYANGAKVLVNYTENIYREGGMEIPSMDFAISGGKP